MLHCASIRLPTAGLRQTAKAVWLSVLVVTNRTDSGRSWRALYRYWWWQIARRRHKPGTLELTLRPSGAPFLLPCWSKLGGMIIANGSHEPNEIAFMLRVVRVGDGFIDVGANIGIYAVLMLSAGANLVAFEPDPTARALLDRNVAMNCEGCRASIFPYAIADWDGTGAFWGGEDVGSRLIREPMGEDSLAVSVTRLDTLLSAGIFDIPSEPSLPFLKIDAEGYDLDVLHGAVGMITAARPTICVEVWDGGREVKDLLGRLGYEIFWYSEPSRSLAEVAPTFSGQGNIIAIHSTRVSMIVSRIDESQGAVQSPPTVVAWRDS